MVQAAQESPASKQAGGRAGVGGSAVSHAYTMVTQMYTVNASMPKAKGSSLFGFPALTLTPIPESPETDSLLNHKERKVPEEENAMWLEAETSSQLDDRRPSKTRKDSLTPVQTSPTCAVNVHLVQTTFFSKDAPMTSQQRRAHLCKLSLFALCGFVFVAGIILWILSPTFT